ncbi:MAG: hypothetical protein IPM41_04575 [Sphingomonadales bacterium]|nr:hypothetical protein [Sphingomonadales bacterium]
MLQLANGNAARVTQDGANNSSSVVQNSVGGSLSYTSFELGEAVLNDPNNTAYAVVQQDGAGLISQISSTGASNFAYIQQAGSANESYVNQTGNGTAAFVEQAGIANKSFFTQTGSLTNVSTSETPGVGSNNIAAAQGVHQTGDRNFSSVLQSGSASSFTTALAGRNSVNVLQTGDDNDSFIDQGGIDNKASLAQDGNLNVSYITQTGTNNTATVSQGSNSNYSSVNQSGNNSTATVTQGL